MINVTIKRLFFAMLLIALALTAAACAGKNAETPKNSDANSDIVEVNTPPLAAPQFPQLQSPAAAAETEVPATEAPATEAPATEAPPVDPNPDLPYYLYLEKGSYTLTVYGKDENFEYTRIIHQYRCGHGGNKTPAGTFHLQAAKERWHDFRLGGTVQFAVPYYGNLYLHSPLYGSANPYTMWPKYYNGEKGIGKDSTGGCIRMVTAAARWIYENCPAGTVFEIVNGSPRGTTSDDIPPMVTYGVDPTDIEVNG